MIDYNIALYKEGVRNHLDMSVIYVTGADGVDSVVILYKESIHS